MLFDFAVCGRNGGGIPYINDKGLVTRDRSIRKDAFYLYKTAWRGDIPVVHLTSQRFGARSPGRRVITAYANTDTLTLSVNGEEVQTLTRPALAGVVWRFSPIRFETGSYAITITGCRDGQTLADTDVWKAAAKSADEEGIFILQQPTNVGATQGSITEILSVEAAAMEETALHYQWYQDQNHQLSWWF